MPAAARLFDPITHTSALGGLLIGAAVGAFVAAAVFTGGASLLVTAAIVGAGVALGAGIGGYLGSLSWFSSPTGNIAVVTTRRVFTNTLLAARAHLDMVACSNHPPVALAPAPIAQGSSTVFINGMPAARVNDACGCGALIGEGSLNVFIGGGTLTTDSIESEVPLWLVVVVGVIGFASAVVLGGWAIAIVGLIGAVAGGEGGHWLGGKLFGENSDGQKTLTFFGGLLGGFLGGKLASSGKEFLPRFLGGGGIDPIPEVPALPENPTTPETPVEPEVVPNEETPQQARANRLDELSKDPDHGNAVSNGTRAEAQAALGAEERGDIPGPVRRPQPGDGHSGDFVDGNGGDWDVKAPRSRENLAEEIKANAHAKGRPEPKFDPSRPIRGEYNTDATMQEIHGELAAKENVLIDTRNMSATDLADLRAAVQREGLGDRVKFWP